MLGEASTGAANDLGGATELAVHMVRDWGLSPRLGPIGYGDQGPGYLGAGQLQSRPLLGGHPARHRRRSQPPAGRGRGACPQPALGKPRRPRRRRGEAAGQRDHERRRAHGDSASDESFAIRDLASTRFVMRSVEI